MTDQLPALSTEEFASLREVSKGEAQRKSRSCTGNAWSASAMPCGGSGSRA